MQKIRGIFSAHLIRTLLVTLLSFTSFFHSVTVSAQSCSYSFTATNTSFAAGFTGYGNGSANITFCGEANDRVYIDYDNWRLYSPSGQNLTGFWTQRAGEHTLATTGVYTIEVVYSFEQLREVQVAREKMEREGWITVYETDWVYEGVQGYGDFNVTLLNQRASWASAAPVTHSTPSNTSQSTTARSSSATVAPSILPDSETLQQLAIFAVVGVVMVGATFGLRQGILKTIRVVKSRNTEKTALAVSSATDSKKALLYRTIGAASLLIVASVLLAFNATDPLYEDADWLLIPHIILIFLFSYLVNRFIVGPTKNNILHESFVVRHGRGVIKGAFIGLFMAVFMLLLVNAVPANDIQDHLMIYVYCTVFILFMCMVLNISAASAISHRGRIIKGTFKIALFSVLIFTALMLYVHFFVYIPFVTSTLESSVSSGVIFGGVAAIGSLFITVPMWFADWLANRNTTTP